MTLRNFDLWLRTLGINVEEILVDGLLRQLFGGLSWQWTRRWCPLRLHCDGSPRPRVVTEDGVAPVAARRLKGFFSREQSPELAGATQQGPSVVLKDGWGTLVRRLLSLLAKAKSRPEEAGRASLEDEMGRHFELRRSPSFCSFLVGTQARSPTETSRGHTTC